MRLVTSQKYETPIIELTEDGVKCYCKTQDIGKVLNYIKGKKDSLNGR